MSQEYLSLRNWKDAVLVTREILCRAAGASSITGLSAKAIQSLSARPLQAIDHLWSSYSSPEFGFAIQHRIFEECQRDWIEFAKRVGWIRNGLWVAYSDVWHHADENDLREGELPIGGRGGFWAGIGDSTLGKGLSGYLKCSFLIMKSALGDLAHKGGASRVGVRFIEDMTLNNGFALAWMRPRELLLDRWAYVVSSIPQTFR